ncbi:alginate lyase family protein [Sphingomonas sp. MMS12-HWE2-04]|uniref:alginate lyase family protein n=1 Tax=Sphingomonas sp. MMS12-HWE2-04 TaxID=3234199 RepID=UPI00384B9E2D
MYSLLAALVLVATPAAAEHHAILGPQFARGVDPSATRDIIRRADAAIGRRPGAIARLHTEGTLPGKGIRDISLKAKQDQPIVLDLALAWRLTGNRRYLDQAGRYLAAWVNLYQMSFNPIDETDFDKLLLATDLTEADLPPALRAKLDRFWRRMAAGYLDAMDTVPKSQMNNWQSHRVKLAMMAAFQTGDAGLIGRARAAFRKQVAANIHPDGSVFDFGERDALHYVTYDLDPLLMAAIAAKTHGEDWYRWQSATGSSLAAAVRWLEPYARGTQTHTEFANSRVAFDRQRAAAGQGEYAPHAWDRGNAVPTFSLAALCDPAWAPLARQLADQTGRRPAAWTQFYRG